MSRHHAKSVMIKPITLIFKFLTQKTEVQIMLFENTDIRIQGVIIGLDEYMNLVLDNASELSIKKKTKKPLGQILLKGDNISLVLEAATRPIV
ncbi:small nuclear ribonucleoprotein E [Dictyostelium discoideum AX4]|uniref:Small nuclear ribonucleoprotein E n=1 Tax=Dictyostelium discoideum TaxID=44689 RepID=C7G054_DICDI|nr:small nuclear ribonucleoprotein E [Dictyostelium discoideum AX4]EEU04068.1 small nuclear ribonucleoprotein E [Dictyostelium discoideum AX4]|eukprot:XP_002649120.1 small nuclear ribonucleoprotein E [Dictyostelium discoideum AX4]